MIVVAVINSTPYRLGCIIIIGSPRYDDWMAYQRLSSQMLAYFDGYTQYLPSLQPPPYLVHGVPILNGRKEVRGGREGLVLGLEYTVTKYEGVTRGGMKQ